MHRGRCTLWLRAGGRRLWDERSVPPSAHSTQTDLGGRDPAAPQGVPCRCEDDLAGCQARSSPKAARPGCSVDTGGRHAGPCEMAHRQLAHRTKGKLKARFAAVRVRVADGPPQRMETRVSSICPARRLGSSANTGCRERRNTISPTCRRRLTCARCGHHQSAMDLRAGSPAAERRTRSRPLRRAILARPASSCAHDNDRIRLPPASPPQNSKAGKKESTGHHLNRPCPPCAKPSSTYSLGHHRNDARTAENGFATRSGVE